MTITITPTEQKQAMELQHILSSWQDTALDLAFELEMITEILINEKRIEAIK